MTPLTQDNYQLSEQESALYSMLDKGIDDMENGRTVPHDEAMKQVRERLTPYGL